MDTKVETFNNNQNSLKIKEEVSLDSKYDKDCKIEGFKKMFSIIELYINKDNIGRHNSNLIRSIATLEGLLSGEVSKEYWLNIFGEKARILYEEGWIYIHNLSKLGPYCTGFTARDVAKKGLNSLAPNNLNTRPPKHLESLINQIYNLIFLISQEVHGATAVNDFTTIVASYLYLLEKYFGEKIDDKRLMNLMESFIYTVNMPLRAGGNSPFSNITMEFGKPDPRLKEEVVIYAGKEVWLDEKGNIVFKEVKDDKNEKTQQFSFSLTKKENERPLKYKDIPSEYFDRVNIAFIKAMAKGDAKGKPFTFPLITINITDDFDFENEAFQLLLKEMDKWGGCYFENFRKEPFKLKKFKEKNPFIQERDEEAQRSMCCRLQLNLEDIVKLGGGNAFRQNAGVGSIGVVNINLNRVLWLSEGDFEKIKEMLKYLIDSAIEILNKKRQWILENKDLYPYFFYYNKNLDTYFNSISTIGLHEGLINIGYENGIFDEEGRNFAHKIYQWIYNYLTELMHKYKVPINHEFAPSETAGPTLAKKDVIFAKLVEKRGKDATKDEFLKKFI